MSTPTHHPALFVGGPLNGAIHDVLVTSTRRQVARWVDLGGGRKRLEVHEYMRAIFTETTMRYVGVVFECGPDERIELKLVKDPNLN